MFPQSEAGAPVVTIETSSSYRLSIRHTVVVGPAQADVLEALTGQPQMVVIGSTAPNDANWEVNQSVSSLEAVSSVSRLRKFEIRVSSASSGFLDAVDATGRILESVPVMLSEGVNVLDGASLPVTQIPPGGRTFYRAVSDGTVRYESTPNENGVAVYFNGDAADGQATLITATGFHPAMAFTYETFATPLVAKLANIDARLDAAQPVETAPVRANPSFVLDQQRYVGAALPTKHAVSGPWVNDAGGVSITAGGGWSTFFSTGGYSNADRRSVFYTIVVADPDSVFGIGAQPQLGNPRYGCVCMVDGVAGKLRLYQWNGNELGSLIKEAPLAPLAAGSTYTLRADQNGLDATYTFTDQVTQRQSTLAFVWSVDNFDSQPFFKGRPGILFLSGSIAVRSMTLLATTTRALKAIILGDSNGDAIVIDVRGGVRVPVAPSWATMIAQSRFERDIMVSVKASDRIEDAVERIPQDIAPYLPERVYIALGTNNGDRNAWRAGVASVIAAILAVGAEPILCCLMPPTGSIVHAAMNEDIRAGYFGPYRFLDFARAVSLNNDGVNWDPIYLNNVDNTHLSKAGQARYRSVLLNSGTLPIAA